MYIIVPEFSRTSVKKVMLKHMTESFQAIFYKDCVFWFVCYNYYLN